VRDCSYTQDTGTPKNSAACFGDMKGKGSMDLAEQLDPEEWHKIVDRFFAILSDGVHRFEGTINQYTGDGIMALFGAPIAHEDHAARACYAALHLRDELSLALAVIFLVMALMFLSVKVGLIAILPNAVSIVIFFGAMGWLDVFLNFTTSLIAAIALGIAADGRRAHRIPISDSQSSTAAGYGD
jgi:hypothetical protein